MSKTHQIEHYYVHRINIAILAQKDLNSYENIILKWPQTPNIAKNCIWMETATVSAVLSLIFWRHRVINVIVNHNYVFSRVRCLYQKATTAINSCFIDFYYWRLWHWIDIYGYIIPNIRIVKHKKGGNSATVAHKNVINGAQNYDLFCIWRTDIAK